LAARGRRVGLLATLRVARGEIALLLFVRLEVSLVPTAALQAERRGGDQPLQRGLLAFRAVLQGLVRELLKGVERVPAFLASVLVNRHDVRSLVNSKSRRTSADGTGKFKGSKGAPRASGGLSAGGDSGERGLVLEQPRAPRSRSERAPSGAREASCRLGPALAELEPVGGRR